MADIYCNDGYEESIGCPVAGASPASKFLRLYSNSYSPVLDESVSNFTECTIPGYSAIALGTGSWVDGSGGGHVVFTYPAQTFTMTGAGDVYGYYVTDGTPSKVFWAGEFPSAPFTFPSTGGTLTGTLELDGP